MLPFPFAPMPADYPGKHVWFTLRFVGDAPAHLPLAGLHASWSIARTTAWVDGATLAVGDELHEGVIVGVATIAGQACWKLDLGKGASRYVPQASWYGTKVERVMSSNRRGVQLEFEDPEDFDPAAFERALVALHRRHPLIAVMFQDGSWHAGEPLDTLDDAHLVARLA